MHKITCRFCVVCLLGFGSLAPLTASEPAIAGNVSGIELCPQFICGSAYFAGYFVGEVDEKPAFGSWSAAVNHTPLSSDPPLVVEGGQWKLDVWVIQRFFPTRKRFGGSFREGTLDPIGGNIYEVNVPMEVESGGEGLIDLQLFLDENSIPQPVNGTLSQP